jgi:hypothetical protein
MITSGPTSVGANAAAYSIPCEKRHLHPRLCVVDFVVEVMDDVDSSGALQCSDYRARSILFRNIGSVRTGTRRAKQGAYDPYCPYRTPH